MSEPGRAAAETSREVLTNLVQELGITIAVAESLTCGSLAAEIGKGENASTWFAGGVVAYTERTKFEVLEVERGPVVTERAARQMAEGVQRLLDADAAVAVTGVGGPGPQEGRPAGTVFIGAVFRGRTDVTCREFEGDPTAVIEQSVSAAIAQLTSILVTRSGQDPTGGTEVGGTDVGGTDVGSTDV